MVEEAKRIDGKTQVLKKTGPEAAERLKALFARWAREEARREYRDEPSWEEVKRILNEGRPADGKPFPEE